MTPDLHPAIRRMADDVSLLKEPDLSSLANALRDRLEQTRQAMAKARFANEQTRRRAMAAATRLMLDHDPSWRNQSASYFERVKLLEDDSA